MPLWTAPPFAQPFPDPIHGFVLRLAGPGGSSWVEGFYESEADAREQARARARADPELTGAVVWEYRYGRIVGCELLSPWKVRGS